MIRIPLFLILCFFSVSAPAALNLDEPSALLARAAEGKNELRGVINDIDRNLAEMRDGPTFDRYFFLLDDLQVLADLLNLDTIYPDAVKRLGGRMVQKGVNWLDIIHDSPEKILYYHRWMAETQPAFAFLYAVDLQIKEEDDIALLKRGAENLEKALVFADEKWPNEKSLRLLYRNTLSDLAIKILKTPNLPEADVLYWLRKVYTPEAMVEITIDLQNRVYALDEDRRSELHVLLKRLATLHAHMSTAQFPSPENLLSQIGDTIVDLLIKSFRFEEKLSDEEFNGALSMMQKRHYASMVSSWTTLNKSPNQDFAFYYIQRAFQFVIALQKIGLVTEAELLSRFITQKSSWILARHHDLEGLWQATDSKGRKWNLTIILANDSYIFANFSHVGGKSMPLFYVVYDMKVGGFIATRRGIDPDLAPNIPIRFFPRDDGTIDVVDLFTPDADPILNAKRIQKFPDLLLRRGPVESDFNGVYEGTLPLPGGGKPEKIRFVLTVINSDTVGNLTHPSFVSTFNYGNDAKGGVVYLTRGNDMALGHWMHLRAQLIDGYLVGHLIFGNVGLMPNPIRWKKVKSLPIL